MDSPTSTYCANPLSSKLIMLLHMCHLIIPLHIQILHATFPKIRKVYQKQTYTQREKVRERGKEREIQSSNLGKYYTSYVWTFQRFAGNLPKKIENPSSKYKSTKYFNPFSKCIIFSGLSKLYSPMLLRNYMCSMFVRATSHCYHTHWAKTYWYRRNYCQKQ